VRLQRARKDPHDMAAAASTLLCVYSPVCGKLFNAPALMPISDVNRLIGGGACAV
jgi:hypothetical protein